MVRSTKTYTLDEYLSEHTEGKDFEAVGNILTNFVGKCIWLQPKKQRWHYNYYTLPTYMIKEVDTQNSRLIVYPIKANVVDIEKTQDYDATEYTTFKYELEKKTKSLKLKLIEPWLIRVGNCNVHTNHIKELDFDKTDKICTYYRMYD